MQNYNQKLTAKQRKQLTHEYLPQRTVTQSTTTCKEDDIAEMEIHFQPKMMLSGEEVEAGCSCRERQSIREESGANSSRSHLHPVFFSTPFSSRRSEPWS